MIPKGIQERAHYACVSCRHLVPCRGIPWCMHLGKALAWDPEGHGCEGYSRGRRT